MTKIRFSFVDVQGNPLPNMEFKLLLRRASFNAEDEGVALPEELTVVTDVDGKVIVDLWPLKSAYRILISDEYEEVCGKLNWSFYVPITDEIIEAQTLFLVPPPTNLPWDEEAMGKITQAVQDIQDNADSAAGSAQSAAMSATSANSSKIAAAGSASSAANSAAASLSSQQAAAASATTASTKATEASNSAAAALASKDAAVIAADNAALVASGVDTKATTALSNSEVARAESAAALAAANSVDGKATTALSNSVTARSEAASALATANGVDAKATSALATAATAAQKSANLSDLSNLSTAVTNLNLNRTLGVVGSTSTADFDTLGLTASNSGWQPLLYGAGPGARPNGHPDGQLPAGFGLNRANYYMVHTAIRSASPNNAVFEWAFPYAASTPDAAVGPKFRLRDVNTVWGGWNEVWHSGSLKKSSQLQQQGGTDDSTWMTPLRVRADITEQRPLPVAAKAAGIRLDQSVGAVGPTWKTMKWAAKTFDTSSGNSMIEESGGVPTGMLYLPRAGVYRITAQLYFAPPHNIASTCSVYIGLKDRGATKDSDALVHVANQYSPPGQHPSLNITTLVQVAAPRYFSLDWYFLDGAGVTADLTLQTASTYTWVDVQEVR